MTALPPRQRPVRRRARTDREPLDAIFHPRSIAVVGATEKEGSVGRTILWNLLSSPFGGTVYPVNPTRPAILGVKAYPSIGAIGEPVDLAVIVTPAKTAPGLVAECGEAGIKGVIIISAGFKEIGPEGVELERQVLEAARRYGIRVVGPNCLGVMNPIGRMNATFAAGIANPGRVGFISPVGRAPHRHPRLGGARGRGLQLDRVAGLDARRGLGRRHRLPGRRPEHRQHRHLHGDHRRRAGVPVRGPRGGADEADHRHQARPHGPGGEGRGLAHGLAHRLGRRARRGLPACRRAARGLDQRAVRGLRDPRQAAAAARAGACRS